jgi:uncharacterized protein
VANGTILDIYAKLHLRRTTLGIGVDFDVHYTGQLNCVRCLGTFTRDFHTTFSLTYIQGSDSHDDADNVNLRTTDIYKSYYTGACVDLSIGIREAVMLNMPIAAVCDPACKGICPVCGKNRNKDSCTCKPETVGIFTPSDTGEKPEKQKGKRQ